MLKMKMKMKTDLCLGWFYRKVCGCERCMGSTETNMMFTASAIFAESCIVPRVSSSTIMNKDLYVIVQQSCHKSYQNENKKARGKH